MNASSLLNGKLGSTTILLFTLRFAALILRHLVVVVQNFARLRLIEVFKLKVVSVIWETNSIGDTSPFITKACATLETFLVFLAVYGLRGLNLTEQLLPTLQPLTDHVRILAQNVLSLAALNERDGLISVTPHAFRLQNSASTHLSRLMESWLLWAIAFLISKVHRSYLTSQAQ